MQPKRDVSRFVKFPQNVRLQRQRRILYQRLKTPPRINMFTKTVDKNTGEPHPRMKTGIDVQVLEGCRFPWQAGGGGIPGQQQAQQSSRSIMLGRAQQGTATGARFNSGVSIHKSCCGVLRRCGTRRGAVAALFSRGSRGQDMTHGQG